MYFKKKYRVAVWAVSCAVGFSLILFSVLSGQYAPQMPYVVPLSQKVNNILAFGLLIALAFPAVVEFNNCRWGRQVDRNIPRLLRDISEAVRSGMTLPKALEEASKRDYGPLSKEIEHVSAMFILGASWEEALLSFAQRVKRPTTLRLATILIEANQTGGRTMDVLDASVDLFSSLDEHKEEQNSNMRPYMATIYMATIIFLIIAYVVLHQFLVPLQAATASTGVSETGLLTNLLDINYYASILFWACIIESIFNGVIAGKIGDGALSAGLRHSVILILVTVIVFNIAGV